MNLDSSPSALSPLTSASSNRGDLNGIHFKLEALPLKANSVFEAAACGRVEDIKSYISAAVNSLDILDKNGVSALHHAAMFDQVQVISLMVSAGASVNIQSKDGFTPLHVASRSNALDAANMLLEKGAKPYMTCKSTGCTPLHVAARFGHKEIIARLLIEKTTDTDRTNGQGMTALQLAICRGFDDICQYLLNSGASIRTTTTTGLTCLHLAAANGNTKIISRIIDIALNSLRSYPADALSTAELPAFKQFVNKMDADCNCALHIGAQTGDVSVCQILVKHGAELNIQNKSLQTPLHVACIRKNKEVLEFLISKGADLNVKDSQQKTPLHIAASFGNRECVQLLLTSGAAVDQKDSNTLTPFLCAVAAGQTESARVLLNCGANITARDKLQRCCVHLAVKHEKPEMLKMLLESSKAGLINVPDVNERTPLHYSAVSSNTRVLEILLERNANCMLKDSDEKTPLHLAAERGEMRLLEALAKASPTSVSGKDRCARTPLHYAAHRRRKACKILLEMDADVECSDAYGWTPLFYAAKSGATDIVQMFRKFNANLDHEDKEGSTALLIASASGHVDTVKLLLDQQVSLAPNKNGLDCLDVAIEQHRENVVMTVVKNPRWKDILSAKPPDGQNRMGKLIQRFPAAAHVVMDRCVQRSQLQRSITYDFRLIDPGPDDRSGPSGESFFGLKTMVEHEQKDLLWHALSRKLLKVKWRTYGWFIYWTNFAVFVLFLVFMTTFMLTQRAGVTLENPALSNKSEEEIEEMFEGEGNFALIIPYLILLFASINLLKELYQIFTQRARYFKQWTNLLEWALYVTTIFFIVPYVFPRAAFLRGDPRISWQMGTFAVFLGYIDLFLLVQTLEYVGIYVTMFLQVTRTIVKASSLFVMFAVAFSVVFFILFKEQAAFDSFPMTLIKVTIMTIGEIDYTSMLVDNLDMMNPENNAPYVPYKETSLIFIFLFVFAMPIILMNLMVGLAVGDIESIQKHAFLRNKKRVIDFVAAVESKFPKWITRRLHKPQLVVTGRRAERKLSLDVLEDKDLSNEEGNDENEDQLSVEILNKELTKAKKRQTSIMESVQEQRNILIAVAAKVGVDIPEERIAAHDVAL